MKTLNTHWKLIALGAFAVMVTIWTGSRMEAKTGQDHTAQSGRVSPQVREAATEVGIVVQGGITQGQILRFNVARLGNVNPGPPSLELRVFDSQGAVLASIVYQNQNNTAIQSSFFALNADQLPAGAFDSTGRAALTGVVMSVDPNNPNKPPNPNCGFVASGEILDSNTAKTLVHIAGAPISECAGNGHF